MPDHFHMLLATLDPEGDYQSLAHVLGSFSRHVEQVGWSLAPPEPVRAMEHVRRTIRYIHLNPCRARLADDPLVWRWSTHRGVVGAEFDPWVTPERLARVFGCSPTGFASQLHRFVSGDPSVSAVGTPFPTPAPKRSSPEVPIPHIVAAARASTPWSSPPVFHRAAVLLARHQAWDDTTAIAKALQVSPRSVRRIARSASPELLGAAALCLGDERLRRDGAVISPGTGRL